MAPDTGPDSSVLQFQWGKKKGVGKKDTKFYESFTFDNQEYWLFDCVYLFKKGEDEPFIGKITKIWEQDNKRKVKLLWFFRPNDISNCLGDHVPMEKEIFLACGEGTGLFNINTLEAISGKCNVVCTSKDERNPQPSKEALESADYIFYCTFDVTACTISDKIPDMIAGVEAKFLLNREKHTPAPVPKTGKDGSDNNRSTDPGKPKGNAGAQNPAPSGGSEKKGSSDNKNADSRKDGTNVVVSREVKAHGDGQNPATSARSEKKKSSDNMDIDSRKDGTNVVESREVKAHGDGQNPAPSSRSEKKRSSDSMNIDSRKDGTNVVESREVKARGDGQNPDIAPISRTEKIELNDSRNIDSGKNKTQAVDSSKNKGQVDVHDDRPSKKMKVSSGLVKSSDDQEKKKAENIMNKLPIRSEEQDVGKGSVKPIKGPSGGKKLNDKNTKSLDESRLKASVSVKKDEDSETQVLDVARKPETDRSKWFKALPWESRMKKANDQGTLVFLYNFDKAFTSSDIEDIINRVFHESCTAKVIPRLPVHSPHYGQAYVICKTLEAADEIVRKITLGCLMQPNGRPILASKGMLPVAPKPSTIPGHLTLDRKNHLQRDDWRKAVSTSHCSQPNTIEYEMALEWSLLQEKYSDSRSWLYKMQGDEIKQLKNSMKPNA